MSEYIFIIIWIGAFAFFVGRLNVKKKENVLGVEEERFSRWFALLLMIPLVFMVANRGLYVGDTYAYRSEFLNYMPNELAEIGSYMEKISKDKGFYFFSALIKIFVTHDTVVYFGILATIQAVSVFFVFRKYSSNFIISVFLFIASSDYVSWMYNGIRQFTAVTIIFAATALLLKKKYVPLILVVVFASFFHQSALLMLPIVFFVQGEAWNKKNVVLIIGVILVLTFVGSFTNFMEDTLQTTQYKNVVSDFQSFDDDGTNPLRVAVYTVPAIISFFGRKKIKEADNKLINLCTNMSIISAGLYLVSMVTSGIFIGRLPIYVSLYSYILLPWEIDNLFEKDMKKIVYGALVILYLLFYYYQMHFTWNVI